MKRKKLLRICAVLSMILCFELVFVLVVRGQGIGGAYRKNLNLGHQYILDEDYDIKEIKSDEINWKSDEVNPTIEIKQKKVKNKRTNKVKTITKQEKVPSVMAVEKDHLTVHRYNQLQEAHPLLSDRTPYTY